MGFRQIAPVLGFALLSLAGTSDDRIIWEKPDAALGRAAATGKPVLWYFINNLLTKEAAMPQVEDLGKLDQAFSNPVILRRRDHFIWVRGDQTLANKFKVQGAPLVIFTDADGDVIHRAPVNNPETLFAAMTTVQKDKYVNVPISWGGVVRTGPIQKRLLIVAFDGEKADGLAALEDRTLVKYHARCEFVKLPYQKDGEDAKKWEVKETPTLLVCDAAEHVLEKLVGKKQPIEIKVVLQKALKKLDDAGRSRAK